MARYDVYGIGNALVDMEYEVTPEILQELSVDKGLMTLVDENRQQELVDALHKNPCKRACGGSAANTMVAISQLGGKGFFSCKVADDETGAFYLEDLKRWGIDSNLQHHERDEGITGKCLVLVTPDADRTMNTYLGAAATLSEGDLVLDALKESEYLYLEGYLVSSPTGKAAALKARDVAREAGVKTAFSLSDPNMVKFFKDGILEIMGDDLDFLFANEGEALLMADTDNVEEAIAFCQSKAKQFAITRGGRGSIVYDGQQLLDVNPVPVKAIDTVGAGDMYAGAFLYGITNGMSYAEAGHIASVGASKIVSRYGPRLETEEVKGLLNNVPTS
ncbi:adenosine kinase [Spirulina sp. CS-785/01]|uniref:adenosine kinase n=1 Tax=Spirulina sp. CS-785/01 TaxID=3021716 RepID=UPI00232C4D1E|nr:adenosine kinase [Spirulina sp. CS-785/01]MDB9313777.1 adenosine kinase [Spirulina sp. CS-785/01]